MHFAERIAAKIAAFGEDYILGSVTYRGIFKPLDSSTMNIYLDDVEKFGVIHPGLLLVTAPDVSISISDTINRDGRTFTVIKTFLQSIASTPVAQFAILG